MNDWIIYWGCKGKSHQFNLGRSKKPLPSICLKQSGNSPSGSKNSLWKGLEAWENIAYGKVKARNVFRRQTLWALLWQVGIVVSDASRACVSNKTHAEDRAVANLDFLSWWKDFQIKVTTEYWLVEIKDTYMSDSVCKPPVQVMKSTGRILNHGLIWPAGIWGRPLWQKFLGRR